MPATTVLPRITPDLTRVIAMLIANVKKDDWKKMAADERRQHLVAARRALNAERKYFSKRVGGKQATAAAPGGRRGKK